MNLAALFEAWTKLPEGAVYAWRFFPYEQDGAVRAIAAMQGCEIHFAIAPEYRYRVITRHRTRAFLGPLLARRGYLTTRVVAGAPHDFIDRLGFICTWRNEHFHHFMLTELPFGREQ